MKGKVYLVGAGPGDPELLTVKAARILREADVVLHDDLVTPEILSLASSSALVVNVGKRCGRKGVVQEEINALMIAHASDGRAVVRLKGGDPLVFGRAGEECDALGEAGVEFEIVPGVTAAFAAAAAAGIPLTDRRFASKLVFLAGRRAAASLARDSSGGGIACDATVAIYMPGEFYGRFAEELTAAGWSADTPCLIVSGAATPGQKIARTHLRNLPQSPRLPAPAVLIVGAVAAERRTAPFESEPPAEIYAALASERS